MKLQTAIEDTERWVYTLLWRVWIVPPNSITTVCLEIPNQQFPEARSAESSLATEPLHHLFDKHNGRSPTLTKSYIVRLFSRSKNEKKNMVRVEQGSDTSWTGGGNGAMDVIRITSNSSWSYRPKDETNDHHHGKSNDVIMIMKSWKSDNKKLFLDKMIRLP